MPQKQIKEKIIEEFREKYSKSPYQLQFKIHTGGFVNNDYELKDAIEDVEDFIHKALSLL